MARNTSAPPRPDRAHAASAASPRPAAKPLPIDLAVPLRARERRWFEELRAASPVELSTSVWNAIAGAYTSRDRHYHTLEHLAEMARAWHEVADGPGWRDPRASWLALLFHDAVMDRIGPPGDDEARSAALLGALLPETEEAERLVRLTATHGTRPPGALDPDAAHFLDCDLAVLGASPARFARYEAQIAAEYAPLYGMDAYRLGRRAFLEAFARQPRIYASDWFHDRLDARARANLARVTSGPA